MDNRTRKTVLDAIDSMVNDGRSALAFFDRENLDDFYQTSHRFMAQCQNLMNFIGPAANDLRDTFFKTTAVYGEINAMIGTLEGLRDSIALGLLNRAESLVLADAFHDWLEQANHLLERGYIIAAGAIARAVLETHLRKWCEREGCSPVKDRPTIEDYKSALYAKSHLDKTGMKMVETLATIGNDAAHAKEGLKPERVEWLVETLNAFLASHPLP